MASISHFLALILLIQGIIVLSDGIPMVEASRALASFDSLTPPPASNFSPGLTKTVSSTPPGPEAGRRTTDSKTNQSGAAESAPSCLAIKDEDIDEEFRKLELEVGNENHTDSIPEAGLGNTAGFNESLVDALSNLKLVDAPAKGSEIQNSGIPAKNKESDSLMVEAA